MNTYEQNISTWLNDESIFTTIVNHNKANPNHQYPVNNIQIGLNETIKTLKYLKKIILQSIDNGVFGNLPVPMQLNINNQVQALFQHRTNINQQILNAQNLYQQVILSNIEYNLKSYDRFRKSLTEIADIKRTYASTIRGLKTVIDKVDTIETNYDKAVEYLNSISEQKSDIDTKLDETQTTFDKSDKLLEEINEAKQDIENAKKEIVAFKTNIDSYKEDIENNTSESQKIVTEFDEKRLKVDKLISDSEKALGLKSTEGMSAALSVQYDKEDTSKKRQQWLNASIAFLVIAFIGVLLLIIKFNIGEKVIAADSINAIIARIVFVAIAIGGASFSAKQYLRQKTLADNYGYKLVLAKSIVAFAQEIKKHDPKKAAEYMNDVLSEINKSPIPNSKEKSEGITSSNIGLIEKIIDLVKTK